MRLLSRPVRLVSTRRDLYGLMVLGLMHVLVVQSTNRMHDPSRFGSADSEARTLLRCRLLMGQALAS